MLIFFHVEIKRLDQTQKQCVSEFLFIRLKLETNLMQACSANQHQVIVPSDLDYQMCPRFVSAN